MTFDEAYPIVISLISKRRRSWTLYSVSYVDFEDIKFEIANHIYKKWHLYDQSQDLAPWINRIITNQIRNKLRNHYVQYARPCVNCAFSDGGDLCRRTPSGKQSTECEWFKDWNDGKRAKYEINFAKPIDSGDGNEYHIESEEEVDYAGFIEELKEKVRENLNPTAFRLFEMLYIENVPEEEAVVSLGYKLPPDGYEFSSARRQVFYYKKKFRTLAKQLIEFNNGGED